MTINIDKLNAEELSNLVKVLTKINDDSSAVQVSPNTAFQPDIYPAVDAGAVPWEKLNKNAKKTMFEIMNMLYQGGRNRVFLLGSEGAGKTWLTTNLAANADHFVSLLSLPRGDELSFYKVTSDHLQAPWPDNFSNWLVNEIAQPGKKISNMIFVADSVDVAYNVGKAMPNAKIILELNYEEHDSLMRAPIHPDRFWSGWHDIFLNEIRYTPEELVRTLSFNGVSFAESLNIFTLSTSNKETVKCWSRGFKRNEEFDFTPKKHTAKTKNNFSNWSEVLDYFVSYFLENASGSIYYNDDPSHGVLENVGLFASRWQRFCANLKFMANDAVERIIEAIETEEEAEAFWNSDDDEFYFNILCHCEKENLILSCVEEIFTLSEESQLDGDGNYCDDCEMDINEFNSYSLGALNANKKEQVTEEPLKFSKISTLGNRLKKKIKGQEEAIDRIVQGLSVVAAGLQSEEKPLRSLLLLGPTGVGKTELAKILADEVFSTPLSLLRLDMSEYSQSHEAAKFMGSPPGYVGFEDGGQLSKHLQKHPRSLILLDEVEKAHHSIWDQFLQVFDAGRMTDNRGNVIDFSQCLIVMTSNLGVKEALRPSSGFSNNDKDAQLSLRRINMEASVKKQVEQFFRPEFINRLDDIIIFQELSEKVLIDILNNEIEKINDKLKARGYSLQVSSEFKNFILDKSDVSKFGARELQRNVYKEITVPISLEMMHSNVAKNMRIVLESGKIAIKNRVVKQGRK